MAQLIKVAGWSGKPRGHVVFVHGLGGHAYGTWRRGTADDSFWPLWLARDIDGLTVWTLSYTAPATNWLGTAPPLQDRAVTVLEQILSEPGLAEAPIAFVCHSLGGLVVKQMLRAANDQREARPAAAALLDRVKAVVFIATPHSGSAHASLLDWLRLIVWPSTAARDLVRNDANLRNLNVWYRNWSGTIAHRIFYELQSTAAGTIVDPGSADAGLPGLVPIGIDADHVRICKPSNTDDLLYRKTRDFLAEEVFTIAKGRKRSDGLETSTLLAVPAARPNTWAPIALRLAVLLFVGFIGFKGFQATFFPGDPLAAATVQEIELALRLKYPELKPEQIERFVNSLREARGDPTFKKAVDEARKGNTRVAEGIWKQIYEDRKKQQSKAGKEQAEAARNLAATAVVGNVAEGLSWYREATTLDPRNMKGWLGLGDAAQLAGTTAEAERAFRQYIFLAKKASDQWAEGLGFNRLGDILKDQGDLDAALKSYRESFVIIKQLADANPKDRRLQNDLTAADGRVGDVLKAQGHLDAAIKIYRNSLVISERLAAANPDVILFQQNLSVVHNKIADVMALQGNLAGALKAYRDSLIIRERLDAANPKNPDRQKNLLAVSHDRIGDTLFDLGNFTAALKSYRNGLAVTEYLVTADPTNTSWKRGLSISYQNIGDVLTVQGDVDAALTNYRKSLVIRENLAARDPNNSLWQRDLSVSYEKIGDVLVAQGDLTGALESFRTSLAIAERLAAADPKHAGWQRDLAMSYLRLAMLGDQPRYHWQRVVDILKRLDAEGRLSPIDKKWLPVAERNLAAAQE